MKLVVNRCFGGYGLSPEAIELYYKKKLGKKVYHFKEDLSNGDYKNRKYIPYENGDSSLFCTSFFVPNPNDYDLEQLWEKHYANGTPEPRDCAFLIETVEELGSKKASGACGKLEIVEIPDGINWEISEYDGNECVEEVHRRW